MYQKWRSKFLILLAICACSISYSHAMQQKDSLKFTNKIVPDSIWREAYIALAHYPELKNTPIEFRFKEEIKKSFMQAQPKFGGIFKNKKKRGYTIFISKKFNIEDQEFSVHTVPKDVLIGWIGHELGHVMDYQNRSGLNLVWFGLKYITSKNYIREAERMADVYAVNHGLGENIIATKDFILNHADLSDAYKSRIKNLYLSQEEILVLIDDIHEEKEEELAVD